MELPPLRTLDDFVLGSARFQLPSVQDFENVYAVLLIMNPIKVVCGLFVQAMLVAIAMQFFPVRPTKPTFVSRKNSNDVKPVHSQQKWYFLTGALLFGYLLLYWLEAILFALFTLLLPISLTFIHASLRLRNIKNKVVNTMESFGPSTPLGAFLDSLNITADNALN